MAILLGMGLSASTASCHGVFVCVVSLGMSRIPVRDGGGRKCAAEHLGPLLQPLGAGGARQWKGKGGRWHHLPPLCPGAWCRPELASALCQQSCMELPPFTPAAPLPVPAAAGLEAEVAFYLSLLSFHVSCPCALLSALLTRKNNPA